MAANPRKLDEDAKARLKKSVTKALTTERHSRPPPKSAPKAYRRGLDMVDAVYGHAWKVIQWHLDDNNLRAAIWCADRFLDGTGRKLGKPVAITEDMTAAEAANVVLKGVFAGEIPMDHGLQLMSLIERAAGVNFAKDIDELRDKIAAMSAPEGGGTVIGQSPAWLKLKQPTHEGNKVPAE